MITPLPLADDANHALLLAGALLLGTILHTFRYIRSFEDVKKMAACFAVSLFGLLPGKHERDYSLGAHLVVSAGWFTLAAAYLFRKRIIGILNEQYLLHINIVYTFFLFTHLDWQGPDASLLFFALLPSIHTLVLILHPKPFKMGINVISFVWFFFMSIIMLVGSFAHFLTTLLGEGASALSLWEGLTMGPVFFLLLAYTSYICSLIPIPGKHQSFRSRLLEVKIFIRELDRAYDDVQLRRRQGALILLIEGGLLWINHYFQFVSPLVAINMSLILFSILIPNQSKKETIIR